MITDPTTAFVQATMDERLRRAEQVRTTRALRREARLAAKAEIAARKAATTSVRTAPAAAHRHPWLWSFTHLHRA